MAGRQHDDDVVPPAADPYGPTDAGGDGGGLGDDPLRYDELRIYGTDQAAGSDLDGGDVAGADVRAWYLVGIVLLVAFIGLLVWSVLQPLL